MFIGWWGQSAPEEGGCQERGKEEAKGHGVWCPEGVQTSRPRRGEKAEHVGSGAGGRPDGVGCSLLMASVFYMKQGTMSAPETKDRRESVGF